MISVNYLWSNSSQLTEEEIHSEKSPLSKKANNTLDEDIHAKWMGDTFRFVLLKDDGQKLFFLQHIGDLLVVHLDVETPPPDRA